jgi:hypothetical protein
MNKMARPRLRERRRRWAQQGSPNKREMECYDLSLWDVRKLSLYGRAMRSVQNGSQFVSFGRAGNSFRVSLARMGLITDRELLASDFLYFHQDGIKRGRVAHVGKFF